MHPRSSCFVDRSQCYNYDYQSLIEGLDALIIRVGSDGGGESPNDSTN